MKTFLIIDANALIHRAFHALPPLTTPQDEPIGAVYGLASMLLKALREEKPDYVAAAFDRPEPTFRDQIFKEYKIHRPPTPTELTSQLSKAHDLFAAFGIATLEKVGFEADDIIGTLVREFGAAKNKNLKIKILTGDLDTLQLVRGDTVVVKTPQKGLSETVVYDEEAIKNRFGLLPTQLPDYKGLVGDPSDNIPGVKGIGPKTAAKLLQEFGNIENLYQHIKPSHPSAPKIIPFRKMAEFSKSLAVIVQNIPLETSLEKLAYKKPEAKLLLEYLTKLGFTSIVNRLLREEGFWREKKEPQAQGKFPAEAVVITDLESARENRTILASRKLKIAYDWKELFKSLNREKIAVEDPIFDLKIGGWLLDPDQKDFSLAALGKRFLHQTTGEVTETFLKDLFLFLKEKIREYELSFIFESIEMPLVMVLAEMEEVGIGVNLISLRHLQKEIETELGGLAKKIYQETGGSFNLNSPRQVAQKLFHEMKINPGKLKKTSTGQLSTAEENLLALKKQHPVVPLILDYRENFKIKTSFVDSILEAAQKDGRVRTTYLQTGTATGRLASAKPNLQNIPQESKWSRPLRKCFTASPGFTFVSFDYSQIELRLLAHVARDQRLIQAFLQNQDIHRLTAAAVFNVPLEKVSSEMRRLGKTLNFGVVYGMGARGFSQTSGLALAEAQEFIAKYFEDFPKILAWQEKVKSEARTFGYVLNLNKRRRWLRGIDSPNQRTQAEMERRAINMPIQSLGADIIKMAIVKSVTFLKKEKIYQDKVRLLLSIHDELLFEVRDDILKEITPPLTEIMESVYKISVPLAVEAKTGKNWGEMLPF